MSLIRWRALILLVGCCLLAPAAVTRVRAAAQGVDPADVWLQAYMLMQEAKEKERSSDVSGAFQKLRQAADMFDTVARTHPKWRHEMVNYRRRMIRNDLERLRGTMSGAAGSGGASGYPAPSRPDQGESGLPSWERPRMDARPSGTPTPVQPSARISPPTGTGVPVYRTRSGSSASQLYSDIQRKLGDLQSQADQATHDRDQLMRRLQYAQGELNTTKRNFADSRKREEALRVELHRKESALLAARSAGQEMHALRGQVDTLRAQLKETTTAQEQANRRMNSIDGELQRAQKMIVSLRSERDSLIKERDRMALIIKNSSADDEAVKNLIAENKQLRSQLEEARLKVTRMADSGNDTNADVQRLRAEVVGLREKLTVLQAENNHYHQKLAELRSRLKDTSAELTVAKDFEMPEAEEENRMLRQIILRQLRREARRQKAKQIIIAELQRLDGTSSSLLEHIEDLAASGLKLTAKERALFKDPSLDDLTNPSTVKLTHIVHTTETASGKPAASNPAGAPKPAPKPAAANPFPAPSAFNRETLVSYFNSASYNFEKGRYGKADNWYRKILVVQPKNVHALSSLGVCLIRLEKYHDAEIPLRKALAYQPDHAFSHLMLGIACYRQGKPDMALEELERSIELDPGNPKARHYVGVVASHEGMSSRAREQLKEAIKLDPEYAEAHFNLAVLYATANEPALDLAKKHYLTAIKLGAPPDRAMDQFLYIGHN